MPCTDPEWRGAACTTLRTCRASRKSKIELEADTSCGRTAISRSEGMSAFPNCMAQAHQRVLLPRSGARRASAVAGSRNLIAITAGLPSLHRIVSEFRRDIRLPMMEG